MKPHLFLLLMLLVSQLSGRAAMPFQADTTDTEMMLKTRFLQILAPYQSDTVLSAKLWSEVVDHYTGERRHYHNMRHLAHFYKQLLACADQLQDEETAFLAMIYHDVIYFTPDGTNEEKSAEMAGKHLQQLKYPKDKIEKCKALIMATKSHVGDTDSDTNYFIDADMSILGEEEAMYGRYVENIRKEYGDSPQFSRGRLRVLQGFLGMERIYKTDWFHEHYEARARQNLANEIDDLRKRL